MEISMKDYNEINRLSALVSKLQAENAKLKERIVEYDEFANERALSDFAKDEEIAKLKEFAESVMYYFEVRAKDPQCAGEVFRELKDKFEALKGESDG